MIKHIKVIKKMLKEGLKMDRYLLRDSNDMDFIKSIDNERILTTRDLKEAMIFDDIVKPKALRQYIEIENPNYDLEIVEIEFKVVEE